jgi:hypothetical protein
VIWTNIVRASAGVKLKSALSQSILLSMAVWITACTPNAITPAVNAVDTTIAQRVAQTVDAYSPTPPPPTITQTPAFTETPIPEPTRGKPPRRPWTTQFTGCWTGPGSSHTLISNINPREYVEIIGMGSVEGWLVIRNPYFHNPCWVLKEHVNVDPNLDLSIFPVMTPRP